MEDKNSLIASYLMNKVFSGSANGANESAVLYSQMEMVNVDGLESYA